ncbi:MAG: hypothetical protein ABIP03_11360 [Aquihabitans sp.]
MARLRPYPVAAFCAVTLFTWGNRIWLAWTNPDDTMVEKIVWSVPITAFVIAALVLFVVLLRGGDHTGAGFVRLVQVFAAGTVVYWAVRAPMILLADHPGAFKVVHAVLAAVSVVAAAFAWRSVVHLKDSGHGQLFGDTGGAGGDPGLRSGASGSRM